jgi:hypothetical protein
LLRLHVHCLSYFVFFLISSYIFPPPFFPTFSLAINSLPARHEYISYENGFCVRKGSCVVEFAQTHTVTRAIHVLSIRHIMQHSVKSVYTLCGLKSDLQTLPDQCSSYLPESLAQVGTEYTYGQLCKGVQLTSRLEHTGTLSAAA